jgi:SAM-dependent methyltransferase
MVKVGAHLFLDRLFQAFGHLGLKEAGATLEHRVKNTTGGTSFADLVWKPTVLIEMKKSGTNLQRHYRQAFDYWVRLVPNRPRYVVLCNFDQFLIYDFNAQMDSPVDEVRLQDLPDRYGPLSFLFAVYEKPVFGNDQQAVTREAANLLALCFNSLIKHKVPRSKAQSFILQMLVALFAEDIGLLKKYMVTQILEECREPRDSYDLLGGLFNEMNTPGIATGGRFKGVEYFNGGLFSQPARLELDEIEIHYLREASKADWSKVSPEIFGALFEHSLEKEERHAYGAHFTSPADIMKIVGPTIVTPWHEQIERAKSLKRLDELRNRMLTYTVLDPACGSGNFLYIAYRELKRLEFRLNERITEMSARQTKGQTALGLVTANQFFGMDINAFAVELAKVTMVIARKLAIDELHINEHPLPLDNLDRNFVAGDALMNEKRSAVGWPKVDVIIGNPPFLGAKRLKPERGAEYVNALRGVYPAITGMSDYCVYWFRKAHDHLPSCSVEDPVAGRAGLVGTQNIRNNNSRVDGLDYIASTGSIVEAVDNQPWSGEANVHVSIVNWVKTKDLNLIPKNKVLWTQLEKSETKSKKRGLDGNIDQGQDLVYREVAFINSSLSDGIDVSTKVSLRCNVHPKHCYQGKIPGYNGFVINRDTALELKKDSANVIFPYLTGRELLDPFRIDRWIIDFGNKDLSEAATFASAFAHCQKNVLPEVKETLRKAEETKSDMVAARKEHLNRWWQLWNRRDELTCQLNKLQRFIGCSRVTRRPIMVFVSARICPSDLVQVFALDDDYSFGILQSSLHFEWFKKSSKMKVESDNRYSVREVFDTFPWPQSPTSRQVEAVASAARSVRQIRSVLLAESKGGLRDLYRLLELPGRHPLRDAHHQLDMAVYDAYGMEAKENILGFLLNQNQVISEALRVGKQAEGPGVPASYSKGGLVTRDCFTE